MKLSVSSGWLHLLCLNKRTEKRKQMKKRKGAWFKGGVKTWKGATSKKIESWKDTIKSAQWKPEKALKA